MQAILVPYLVVVRAMVGVSVCEREVIERDTYTETCINILV